MVGKSQETQEIKAPRLYISSDPNRVNRASFAPLKSCHHILFWRDEYFQRKNALQAVLKTIDFLSCTI